MKIIKNIHATLAQIDAYGNVITQYPLSVSKHNENGNRIYYEIFNEEGETENKIIHEVDSEGYIRSEIHFERLNELMERSEYFGTEDNIQYKSEITKTDGSKLTHEIDYNQLGNTDRITIKNDEGGVEAYEFFRYNDKELLIEEVRTDANQHVQFGKKMFYNDRDFLIREEYYSDNHKLNRQVEYSYNNQDLISEKRDVSYELGTTNVSHYTYDESGNQIQDDTYLNGVLNFRNECHYDEWNNLIEEKVIQLGSEYNQIELIQYTIEYW